MTIYWGSAISVAFFLAVAAFSNRYLNFQGPTWYLFLTMMGSLGLTSSALFYYLQNKWTERRARKQEEAAAAAAGGGAGAAPAAVGAAPEPGESQHWIKEANNRLAQSRPGVGIENLPMIFVAGDRGTAKTSTILNSGLEPELLAGQIYQDNAIAPTRGANIFFARETVFVEAGGALMASPSAWKDLIKKLRPGRLKTIGKSTQAPRAVLVCFDLEAFTRQGASDAITAAARYLHDRLGEISQELGISFPVYVLFTRADRLPFFAEFVGNLTLEEAGQVVGVTLPLRSTVGGVYAEAETQRLSGAFNALFYSFADQRLRLLPREIDPMKIPGTYEFPREFRKLRAMLVQFLVDVGRPSQLRASPFLRGFYFSGVRPVQVQAAPAAPQPIAPQPAQEVGGGATRMFRVGFQEQQRAMQAYAQQWAAGTTKKVPQWLFLGHLFHDVILADTVSRAASGSSVRTSIARRVLLAAAAVFFLGYLGLLTISYFGNRALEREAILAAQSIGPGEAMGGAVPTEEGLRHLDELRQSLQKLTDYRRRGAPLWLRWGLYSGDAMLNPVRQVYYSKFRQLLFGGTQDQILSFLRTRPPVPGATDDYGYAYDSLKAYLLTTSEWERSRDASLQAFLGTALLDRWRAGRDQQIGDARRNLAKLQFDFYARDLQNGNPYAPAGDAPSIARARVYLWNFAGEDRIYRFLLSEAARTNPAMTFNGKFPGSSAVVTSTVEVAWAFTREGFKFMLDRIRKQNIGGEEWVLGPALGQRPDAATLEKGILDHYTQDYIDQWRRVLNGSNVNRYADARDASRKLDILTRNDAPLLALFWWTTYHTKLDEFPAIADKFKPVYMVVPFSTNPIYIGPTNAGYNNGLINLKGAVDRFANRDPDSERGMRDVAGQAEAITKQLSATFPPDREARIDRRTETLLLQPIQYVYDLVGADLRSSGQRFCIAFGGLTNKFPFNPTAVPEVTLAELADILQPPSGQLWTFYNNSLKSSIQCQNGLCTATNPQISPRFVRFLGDLMQFSRALYGDAGTEPNYRYTLRPEQNARLEAFNVTINGESVLLRPPSGRQFVWPGTGMRSFKLGLRLTGGGELPGPEFEGLWAVFRFFADANRTARSGTGNIFEWDLTQGKSQQTALNYRFFVDTNPAVFSKDFLSTLRCIGPLAR
jgi:type VI secretion system protein ImpL